MRYPLSIPSVFQVLILLWAGCPPPSGVRAPALEPLPAARSHAATVKHLAGGLIRGEWAQAIWVAIITPRGVEQYGFGTTGIGAGSATPTASTVFAIGSITKVFTGLLLQQMIAAGQVSLDDTVGRLWPSPKLHPSVRKIRLRELVTHTSGLPRMPPSFAPPDAGDPYASYSATLLESALAKVALKGGPHPHRYSNLGMGLLGYLLSRKAGRPYPVLVRERVLKPLGLHHTGVPPHPLPLSWAARMARPYSDGVTVPKHWRFAALAGAGALYATGADLIRFVRLMLAAGRRPRGFLGAALAPLAKRPKGQVGSGWMIDPDGWVWHDGGTGGYRAHLAFHPGKGVAVIALASASSLAADYLVGNLRRKMAGEKLGRLPPSLTLTRAEARRYAGTYHCGKRRIPLIIQTRGARLLARFSDQPFYRVYVARKDVLYYRIAPAALRVTIDPRGRVTAVGLRQGKLRLSCPRRSAGQGRLGPPAVVPPRRK